MDADDLILVSVDDDLVEPPDVFANHLPAKYRDQSPRVVTTDDGADVWISDGDVMPNIGLNALAGRPREECGIESTAFTEMRPGCFDIHECVKNMNAGVMLGSMCIPSFPGLLGRVFAALRTTISPRR
jgi:hypothetical protein